MESAIRHDLRDYSVLVVGNLPGLRNNEIDLLLLSRIVALCMSDRVTEGDRDDVRVGVVVVLLPPALVLRGLQQDDVIVVLAALAVAVVVHVEERVGVHAADVHGQLAHSTLERKTSLYICWSNMTHLVLTGWRLDGVVETGHAALLSSEFGLIGNLQVVFRHVRSVRSRRSGYGQVLHSHHPQRVRRLGSRSRLKKKKDTEVKISTWQTSVSLSPGILTSPLYTNSIM